MHVKFANSVDPDETVQNKPSPMTWVYAAGSPYGLGLACPAKGHSWHTKISSRSNYLREQTSKSATKRPLKIMYLGLDIRIKLKLITNFDGCAILYKRTRLFD